MKTIDSWAVVTEKARGHQLLYPTFKLDDYLEFVKSQGAAYIRWAASRPVPVVNKSRKSRLSIMRLADTTS